MNRDVNRDVRSRLHVRIAALGAAVIAVTLAAVALLTYQLVLVGGRAEVERVLQGELAELARGLPTEIQRTSGSTPASPEQLDLAVRRYLAVNPGSERHLTMVRTSAGTRVTQDGPPELLTLAADGRLPAGTPGTLSTVDTPAGPVRILSGPITGAGVALGTVTVAAPLSGARTAATEALTRIALAGSVGLLLGGALLLVVMRNALRPVRALAGAARSVGGRDLTARVPEPPRLDEVGVLAREFNRMLERMSDEEQQRSGLLSAVTHELRTPLAVAEGHLEVFETLGPADGQSAADTARVVRSELDRLHRVLNDLSAITEGEQGSTATRDPVFAPDVLDALAARLSGLGLTTVRIDDAAPVVALGDQDRLAQALLNLVTNATTHTPPGTTVRVSAHPVDGEVVFAVHDNGPGIDPAVLPRVFEPFVTTRTGGSRRGSGLGLAVVKAVIQAQGGRVQLDTGPSGTTVALHLPQAQ